MEKAGPRRRSGRTQNGKTKGPARVSEVGYRSLAEIVSDGVVTCREGRIAFANAAFAQFVGAERAADLVGISLLDRVHPESVSPVRELLARAARRAAVPPAPERLLRLDGGEVACEIAAASIGKGETLVVVRDASGRPRADAEREALEERLGEAQRLEALGTLAGGVAHDFNNVLAAILGHASTLAAETSPGSVFREDAERIAAAAQRAKGVVRQILAFVQRRPAEPTTMDAGRVVREEMPLLRAATPSNVEMSLRVDPDAGALRADPTRVHQILLNLCANARDAMRDCGGRLEIAVERAAVPGSAPAPDGLAKGPYVRIAVKDTGHGMDAATRARALERYFTTKALGGSGLGLSVVHGIATQLGGGVSLASEPGRGTTVEVWLPRLDAAEVPREDERPDHSLGWGRILLVEDDPQVATAVERMLEALGYEVTAFASGLEALERFRAGPDAFDAVLTDQTLPGLGGDELARALLALRPELPVIICSGFSERVDEERARQIGARAFLLKPLDLAQLAEALRSALAGDTEAGEAAPQARGRRE